MRSKEEAHDYRYFPEPDLLPVIVDEKWKNEISHNLPELPEIRKEKLITKYNLPEYDAELLTQNRSTVDYYEKVVDKTSDYKSASNWIMGDVLKSINEVKIDIENFPIQPENLAELINIINNGTINGKIGKDVFQQMLKEGKNALTIVKEKNLVQITDSSEIENIIDIILEKNSNEVKQYIDGKEKVFGFFVGQVMRETKGKANPKVVNEILREKLNSLKEA